MNLTGSLSSDLAQLKNLVNISVDSNNFTGDLPAEIVSLPFLQFLNISNNNFSNYFPSNFSHLRYLQVNFMFPAHSVCQLLWLFLVRLLVVGKAPGWGHYQNKGTTQGGGSQGGAHILVTP